jgi:hypothetical protein
MMTGLTGEQRDLLGTLEELRQRSAQRNWRRALRPSGKSSSDTGC